MQTMLIHAALFTSNRSLSFARPSASLQLRLPAASNCPCTLAHASPGWHGPHHTTPRQCPTTTSHYTEHSTPEGPPAPPHSSCPALLLPCLGPDRSANLGRPARSSSPSDSPLPASSRARASMFSWESRRPAPGPSRQGSAAQQGMPACQLVLCCWDFAPGCRSQAFSSQAVLSANSTVSGAEKELNLHCTPGPR